MIGLTDIEKRFGDNLVLKGVTRHHRRRQRHRAGRPVRRRQEHAAALHQPPGDPDLRHGAHRRRDAGIPSRHQDPQPGHPAPAAADRHGVPEFPAVPAPHRDRECHGGAGDGAEMANGEGARAGAGAARKGRHGAQGRCLAGDAVGRPAAARGDRPGAWRRRQRCCCATSRPRRSIRNWRRKWSTCWHSSPAKARPW